MTVAIVWGIFYSYIDDLYLFGDELQIRQKLEEMEGEAAAAARVLATKESFYDIFPTYRVVLVLKSFANLANICL